MNLVANMLTLAVLTATPAQPPPPPAQGRFNFGQAAPGALSPEVAYSAGATRGANAGYTAGFRTGAYNTPYYASGYYGPVYDPVGGFMNGAANVIGAQGQFNIDVEQSRLVREQVKQSQIDTRRKSFEEWQWERANTPTTEDERERARMEQLRRSRNDPPYTEILSAHALNELFQPILKMNPPSASLAPYVPLDQDLLRKINVTTGATLGSLGVLKDGGKLRWPFALQEDQFEEDRTKLDKLALQAFTEAEAGNVKAKTVREMSTTLDDLIELLKKNVGTLTPNDYIPSRRYLTELESSIRTLKDPNVVDYVKGNNRAQGEDVYSLTANMSRLGLKFAPSTGGDEAAYVSVHRAMVTYLNGLEQVAGPRR